MCACVCVYVCVCVCVCVCEGSLAQPVGFTEVWNDAGSGVRRDVKIYRMDPSPGYTCLGYVAAGSSVPDLFHYR